MARVGATWSIKKSKKDTVEALPTMAPAAQPVTPVPTVAVAEEATVIDLNDIVELSEAERANLLK